MSTPATAGPTMRAALKLAELRPTALVRSSRLDDLGDERLARGGVEGGRRTEDEGEHVDVPDLDGAGDGEQAEHQRGHGHAEVGQLQQAALGDPVGDQPGERGEEQERQELQPGGDADRGAGVVGERAGPASPGPPAASRCRRWRRHCRRRTAGSWRWRGSGTWDSKRWISPSGRGLARIGAAWRSTARSSGVRSRSRRASQASRRARSASTTARPVSERLTSTCRPSVSCGRRATYPLLLEAVDGAGHARRLHPLVAGQLADGEVAAAVERAEHGHRAEAQLVVRVPLGGQPAPQPHHGQAELRRQAGVGAGRPSPRWACR